jgi:response regulator NasT
MRVWLVDDRPGSDPGGLEVLLHQLAARAETGLTLLVVRAVWPDFASELRAHRPDILIVREPAMFDGPCTEDILNLGPALLIAASSEFCDRYRTLAEAHPVCFLPPCPTLEGLWLALIGALAAQRRQASYKAQVVRLQQRLNDRIIIERAKGVLVQRLGVSEEDAYKRLRVLSRRQRRQIRDIAQSLLDTQALLLPGGNGYLDAGEVSQRPEAAKAPPEL